jgi:hypothetical protein
MMPWDVIRRERTVHVTIWPPMSPSDWDSLLNSVDEELETPTLGVTLPGKVAGFGTDEDAMLTALWETLMPRVAFITRNDLPTPDVGRHKP